MDPKSDTQRTLQASIVNNYLLTWLEAFLIDCKSEGVAVGTMRFYRQKIKLFSDFCQGQEAKQIERSRPLFYANFCLPCKKVVIMREDGMPPLEPCGPSFYSIKTKSSQKDGQTRFER
jgi:hypothetical protein